jgi:uncharacterized membrane protein YfcA
MTVTEIIALAAAGGIAGVINAVAGGGTLLTFPSLMAFGASPIVANATSTLALVLGNAGSLYGYRNQVDAVKPWLRRFTLISFIGAIVGSFLLVHLEEKVFSKAIPFLLLFATILFLAQGAVRRLMGFTEAKPKEVSPHHQSVWGAIVFQFFIAVYGGYFGAGIGILMLASLGFLGLTDIHEMNTVKTVLSALINVVAAVYFIFCGLINWPMAIVMTVGAVAGYFLGAHYAQRIPQKMVRQIITGVGFVISGVMFYKQFVK